MSPHPKAGKTRLTLSAIEDGSMLVLNDQAEKSGAMLSADKGESGLVLFDGEDRVIWRAPK